MAEGENLGVPIGQSQSSVEIRLNLWQKMLGVVAHNTVRAPL